MTAQTPDSQKLAVERSGKTSTRIDAAHWVRDDAADAFDDDVLTDGTIDAITGMSGGVLADQMRHQAEELSSHLRSQQRNLEQREAAYNSHVAQMENEFRKTRLLMREREQLLVERELDLDRDVQAIQQASGLLAPEKLPRSEPRSEASNSGGEAVADSQSESDEQLERKRKALDARRHALDGRQRALDQLHTDVARMNREALETRLCVEELWAQLLGKAPPAELAHRLSQLRRQLADHFRLSSQSLAAQKQELHELVERLANQRSALKQRQSELENWLTRRQAEIEEQAARLVAREQQLDRQESEMLYAEHQWDAQRREYQNEIRRLTNRLRSPSASGDL